MTIEGIIDRLALSLWTLVVLCFGIGVGRRDAKKEKP